MDYDLAPPFLTEHQSGIETRGYLDLPNLQSRTGTLFRGKGHYSGYFRGPFDNDPHYRYP